MNRERAIIIESQSKCIEDFSNKIKNFDLNQRGSIAKLKQMVSQLNGGHLFKSVDLAGSIKAALKNDSRTQYIKGVTGDELGNNKLLQPPKVDDGA